jgi:hypothetical protein
MDYMVLKTIVTSIAAASIALAAPAYADNGKTVCTSMGNSTTHARGDLPVSPWEPHASLCDVSAPSRLFRQAVAPMLRRYRGRPGPAS